MRTQPLTIVSRAFTSVLALGLITSVAHADETDAKNLLKAMSDYVSGQQSVAFDYDATLEIVTTEDQKLGIATSGNVSLMRPNNLKATRVGGYSDIEMMFDGTSFNLLSNKASVYTQLPVQGSVDNLIDVLRESYGAPLPAADLLTDNPYESLMGNVTDVKDLGVGVIGGKSCDHLAFRTPDVDWQIWIATGDHPYPCKYVITTHSMTQGPQYTVNIRNWQTEQPSDIANFTFNPPKEAKALSFDDYHSAVREFPEHYQIGESK